MPSAARRVLALLLVLAAVLTVGGCSSPLSGVSLTFAAGGKAGVYYQLGTTLAGSLEQDYGANPQVKDTAGSVDALNRLEGGQVDLAFAAADAAVRALDGQQPGRALRALARIHDDYFHVFVREDSRARRLADLRGLRIGVGSETSGTRLIGDRLLAEVRLTAADMTQVPTDLGDSMAQLQNGGLDGFFWSGGLPTKTVVEFTKKVPVRMLDLGDVLPGLLTRYSEVYGSATVPTSTYRPGPAQGPPSGPVTTLLVRNFLLATEALSADVAEALVSALFQGRDRLVAENEVARSLDPRSAIETSPIALHEGALRYYRDSKV